MTAERRGRLVRRARTVAGVAAACVIVCGAAAIRAPLFAAAGTLACAVTACAALYAAFEGFDAILRRPRSG
jgi:hypothetical protein